MVTLEECNGKQLNIMTPNVQPLIYILKLQAAYQECGSAGIFDYVNVVLMNVLFSVCGTGEIIFTYYDQKRCEPTNSHIDKSILKGEKNIFCIPTTTEGQSYSASLSY